MFNPIIDTILHSMFPIGELRTAIPVAIHVLKLNWSNALFYSLFGNSLVTLILVYLIDFFKIDRIKYFVTKIHLVGAIFTKWENSSTRKSKKIEKWGYIGLMLFMSLFN